MRTQRRQRPHIVLAPGRVQAIDAHDDAASSEAALAQGVRHLHARLFLGRHRDRVFQVENQRIGVEFAGARQRARVGAGGIKHRAEGAHGVRGLRRVHGGGRGGVRNHGVEAGSRNTCKASLNRRSSVSRPWAMLS
ncbi:Uncharacterised protein [Bordetella pertussis]|nr:Uncharacterised protein [Bordetella pertussis]CFW46454.1 Uncharacterised protein [Bordetella pertussis]